eukprot:jgi/Chrpa1/19705/Chrysochromulina_OHIO_Genome00027077-RA
MVTFCELLKIIWQLWTNLLRKQHALDAQRRSIEMLARVAGSAIVKQLTDQAHRLAHTAPSMPVGPDRSRFFDLEDDPPALPTMHSQASVFQKPAPGPPATQEQQLSSSLPGMGTMTASQPQPLFDASHLPPPPQQQQHIATSTATMIDQPSSQQPLPAASQAVTAPGTAPAPSTALLPDVVRVGLLEPADTSLSAAINGLLEGTDGAAVGSGWASVVRRPASDAPPPAAIGPPIGPPSTAPPASPKPARLNVPASAPTAADGDEQIPLLVAKREHARAARDFESADKLREQLARLGVTLDDQSKVWRCSDGRSGAITAVNISELHAQKAAKAGAASLTDDEIDRLVREREQARFTSDYKTADVLRETLEKHGVHLDTKENKWQAADGRSGPIGPVNISAAHAQKAARSGAPKMALDEIEKLLVLREQARARRDYKTADVMRDTLEKHGVYLDAKEKKWHAADGRSGAIVVSTLSNEEVGRVLANRQAARLRHDFKSADRLRDQLNEQGLSVDDKRNRWESSDGRSGSIDPFTSEVGPIINADGTVQENTAATAFVSVVSAAPPPASPIKEGKAAPATPGAATSPTSGASAAALTAAPAPQPATPTSTRVAMAAAVAASNGSGDLSMVNAGAGGGGGKAAASEWQSGATPKSERKKSLTEKERRELAKQLRAVTGASARLCEKALQSHADDMERAANWLLEQGEQKGDGGKDGVSDTSSVLDGSEREEKMVDGATDEDEVERVLSAMVQNLQSKGHAYALVLCNAASLPPPTATQYLQMWANTEQAEMPNTGRIFYTPFESLDERTAAEAAIRQVATVLKAVAELPRGPATLGTKSRLLLLELASFDDTRIQMAVEHLVLLQRSGRVAQVQQEVEAAAKVGVTIDLAAGRWRSGDGRSGTTEPFAVTDRPASLSSTMAAAGTPTKQQGQQLQQQGQQQQQQQQGQQHQGQQQEDGAAVVQELSTEQIKLVMAALHSKLADGSKEAVAQ